ncbi:NAD(P)H-hydrate dehydratase [Marinobacter sp.]|uniref:NAD(P)H-hydrate dehydratase n=1 Tax=Marinobacter sp. TaxID=50741 RepID=UPI003850987B
MFSASAVRAIDEYVIEEKGIGGFDLMQRAAAAAFRQLVRSWPEASAIMVFCGGGNNGGDGYLVAAAARRHGLEARCIAVKNPDELEGDAARACRKAGEDGVPVDRWDNLDGSARQSLFDSAGLIVDAMLGTGIKGAPREPYKTIIEAANAAPCPVMAIDIPSGLDATTGVTEGAATRADVTATFIALKSGLFLGQGPECAGRVSLETLQLEFEVSGDGLEHGQSALASRFDWTQLAKAVPRRPVTAHKGRFGHVLVVAGDHGMGGAGLMVSEAAARTGAGLVTLATRPEHVAPALARCPSLLVRGVTHGSELGPLIEAADVLVCGPGLGKTSWGQQMLQQVMASGKDRVLDADALNLMAEQKLERTDNQILTPHPGEAARLLACSVGEIESDRLAAAVSLQEKYGGVALLKGAGTVIADGKGLPAVLDGSNPGMATGGMGDVLSGIIGSLLGQGLELQTAARMAAALHLAAANMASRQSGYMGLLPMDVTRVLPRLLARAEGMAEPEAI